MRIFAARLALAQVVEAEVGNDPVNPGIERTFKTEITNVTVGFEESFLIDVLSVCLRVGEMKSQPQHRLVVLTNQRLKRSPVTALRGANQIAVIQSALSLAHSGSRWLGVSLPAARTYRYPDDCCPRRHLLCPS